VTDAECSAGERVERGSVAAAVVGEQPLDGDAVPLVEGDGSTEEADDRGRALVGEDFGIGEAAVVVDADVDVLPADGVADDPVAVGAARVVVLIGATADAFAGAAADAAELLDVDVDELARP